MERMRELTSAEYYRHFEPCKKELMGDSEFLKVYRDAKVPECYKILGERAQEVMADRFDSKFKVEVTEEDYGYSIKCYTDSNEQLPYFINDGTSDYDDDDDDEYSILGYFDRERRNNALSEFSAEELLLELLRRVKGK